MIALVGWATAGAAVVQKYGTVCLEFTTNFTDPAGDYWTGNQDKLARGVQVEVTDANSTDTYWLDDETGCLFVFVDVEQSGGAFTLKATSKAQVHGVTMHSWRGPHSGDKTFASSTWSIGTNATNHFGTVTRDLPWNQRWANLAVGTYAFYRHDWGLGTGGTRGCCLEDRAGYAADGTCTATDKGYTPITTPVQFQVDTNEDAHCCQSHLTDDDQVDDNEPPGVRTDENRPEKFPITHELGHVIAGMRMGGKEFGEYPGSAAPNGCTGTGQWTEDGWQTVDESDPDARARFGKEYVSNALREGWADFVGAVVWNDRSESDCVYQNTFFLQDMDLDGDPDNDHATDDARDGQYDCEGIPNLWGTLPSWVTSRNWLDDVEDEVTACEEHANAAREANRASTYDVERMFWDLTTDQALTPAQLATLYIDSCPRGWSEEDAPADAEDCDNGVDDGDTDAKVDCLDPSCATDAACADALPLERLILSAQHHGWWTGLLEDEVTHVVR